MVLAVHSDAGYLNECNAYSQASGSLYLPINKPCLPNNGAILYIAQIVR